MIGGALPLFNRLPRAGSRGAYVLNNGINELIIEPEGEPEESEDDPGSPAAAPGAAG